MDMGQVAHLVLSGGELMDDFGQQVPQENLLSDMTMKFTIGT